MGIAIEIRIRVENEIKIILVMSTIADTKVECMYSLRHSSFKEKFSCVSVIQLTIFLRQQDFETNFQVIVTFLLLKYS